MQANNMQEQSNTESNAQENGNNSQLITRNEIKGTPFDIITTEEGSFLAIGHYRLSEIIIDIKELLRRVEEKDWHTMINLITATIKAQQRMEAVEDMPQIGA